MEIDKATFFLTHPADGEEESWFPGTSAHETVPQAPVEPMLPHKGDQTQCHGSGQHVKHARHVINIQLAAHHFILLIVTDAS